jgi:hypothetical protein
MTEREASGSPSRNEGPAAWMNDRPERLDATRGFPTFSSTAKKKCTEVNRVGVSYSSHDHFMRINSAQLFFFFFFSSYIWFFSTYLFMR